MADNRAQTLLVVVVVVLLRLVVAAVAPIVQDETYYLAWAAAPDWGYFDHPPGVAWIAATGLSWGSPLAGRLGSLAVAALAFPFAAGLLVRAGITERRGYLAGLLLLTFNFCALAAGTLTTPDAALVTAWSAALHEAATALRRRRTRWISAGLATGLGLLAKYNMVLIGPAFAWALWRGDRRALRTPWPWLGATSPASCSRPTSPGTRSTSGCRFASSSIAVSGSRIGGGPVWPPDCPSPRILASATADRALV